MCRHCLAAYIINSAAVYAQQNGLTDDDIVMALCEAVEALERGVEETGEEESDFESAEIITFTIQ